MQWPFNKLASPNLVVLSLAGDFCRFSYFTTTGNLALKQVQLVNFEDLDELQRHLSAWLRQLSIKNARCCWLLTRDRYQTLLIDKPDVDEEEIDQAAKWLVRDQLDFPPDDILMQHYQPKGSASRDDQLVLVTCQRAMIEKLIAISQAIDLDLQHIAVEEICLGYAFQNQLQDEQICGFIGEDKQGLIFNFYKGNELTFSRFIRGKHFPKLHQQELALDDDVEAENEQFLLEIQRTMDYAVNQIYRSPVSQLLIQPSPGSEQLLKLIVDLTEVEATIVTDSLIDSREQAMIDDPETQPWLSEVGLALRSIA